MDITITTTKDNQLLHRKEIAGTIKFTGATPPYDQIKQTLATQQKIEQNTIALQHVYTTYGSSTASFTAHLYDTPEHLKRIEPPKKEKKDKKTEEKT